MHIKIKALRQEFGLTESQVSSLLNISCYKYRRFENGTMTLTVDVLLLLSIMYDISIDMLVFDGYDLNTIFKSISKNKCSAIEKEDSVAILEYNMCKYCTFSCDSVNYRTVRNIQTNFLHIFTDNLQKLRCSQFMEIVEIASVINVDKNYYVRIEKGEIWPSICNLIDFAKVFGCTIADMFI